MCFVSVKLFIILTIFVLLCSHLTDTTITMTITSCSTQLFCLQPHLFCYHATSHRTDWITTDCCPLRLAFLYTHTFSLQNVLKVESLRSCLLENFFCDSLCMCILILVSVYLCIVYILPLVAFACVVPKFSISFMLMLFVFAAFAFCFHVNDIRSFRAKTESTELNSLCTTQIKSILNLISLPPDSRWYVINDRHDMTTSKLCH